MNRNQKASRFALCFGALVAICFSTILGGYRFNSPPIEAIINIPIDTPLLAAGQFIEEGINGSANTGITAKIP